MAATDTLAANTAVGAIGAKVDAGRTRLAENFEMFLTLLTTQLKNQDPLAPMDGNQFTQQLVQMTSVEQQLLTNDLLKEIAGKGDSKFSDAVEMIGKGVTIQSPDATLAVDGAHWTYELPTAANEVSLQVKNAKGAVVWEDADAGFSAGKHAVDWDGKIDGAAAPAGVYTLSVTAKNAAGAAVASRVYTDGLVSGVEQKSDGVYLSVGRSTVPLSTVQSVWLAVAGGASGTGG